MPSLRLIRRRLDPALRHVMARPSSTRMQSAPSASILRGYTTGFGKARDTTPRAPAGAGRRPKRLMEKVHEPSPIGASQDIGRFTSQPRDTALHSNDEVEGTGIAPEASPRIHIQVEDIVNKLENAFPSAKGSAEDVGGLSPLDLLNTVHPLIQADTRRHNLQQYILPIATTLSQHFTDPSTPLPPRAVQKSLSEVMFWCHSYALASTGNIPRNTKGKSKGDGLSEVLNQVKDHLARVVIHLSINGSDAEKKGLLSRFTQSLHGVRGYDLGVPIVAALAVLRQEYRGDIPLSNSIRCVWPSGKSISEYLNGVFDSLAVKRESSEYADSIHSLIARKTVPDLPPTLDALRSRLTQIIREGTEEEVITLYQVYLAYQTVSHLHKTPPPALMGNAKNEVLIRFLYALTSPKFGGEVPRQPLKLELMMQDVLVGMKKPWDLEVWYSFIAHRARAVEDAPVLEGGEVVVSMLEYEERVAAESNKRRKNKGVSGSGSEGGVVGVRGGMKGLGDMVEISETKKEVALERLRASWRMMDEEGVGRDVKLYMLMIEGLGRLGDCKGLQGVWNEMANDEHCREKYRQETEDPRATFPPTKALNHMISACLLVPRDGPPIALELFNQACSPDSSIPCNLVTINTILRHHARQADIPAMKSLFLLASRLNLTPDAITYTTLVQGLLRAGAVDQAKIALDNMSARGIQTTERMCSLLIADLSKDGHRTGLAHAEELMNEMRRRGFEVGVVTWTGLISGYFRGGWESDAWQAVRRMESTGLRLNRVAYNVILKEAGRSDRRESAVLRSQGQGMGVGEGGVTMRIFRKMVKEGTIPNGDTYYIILGPFVRMRSWGEAEEVMGEMKRFGFVPEKGNLQKLVRQIQAKR